VTPEQEGLLQKGYRGIRSAKLLAADGDFDTAVSRAYYAMFYVAEALLLSKGLAYSKHSAAITAFGREFAKPGVLSPEFHAHLRAASEARNISDYQVASHVTEEETAQHISRAERLLAAAREFLKDHPTVQADS
jgi:uncharacterized protein (UPF0332 family)